VLVISGVEQSCSLLRRSEIAATISAEVDIGHRVQAIGESVSTSLDTLTVYLGHGLPPRD
jgi:hypothetical protein